MAYLRNTAEAMIPWTLRSPVLQSERSRPSSIEYRSMSIIFLSTSSFTLSLSLQKDKNHIIICKKVKKKLMKVHRHEDSDHVYGYWYTSDVYSLIDLTFLYFFLFIRQSWTLTIDDTFQNVFYGPLNFIPRGTRMRKGLCNTHAHLKNLFWIKINCEGLIFWLCHTYTIMI